jgi:hypothetical protein
MDLLIKVGRREFARHYVHSANEKRLVKMPATLCKDFLGWLQSMNLAEYIKIKEDNEWVRLDSLRQLIR